MKHALLVAVLAATAAACGSSGSSTTAPTVTTITEPAFTGTVQPQGSVFTGFQVNGAGTVTITLTSAGPPATIFMGVGVGLPGTAANGAATCVLSVQANMQAGQSLSATATGAVSACASIYDVGNQTAPVDFSISIAHP
jgi:hypothetical protein